MRSTRTTTVVTRHPARRNAGWHTGPQSVGPERWPVLIAPDDFDRVTAATGFRQRTWEGMWWSGMATSRRQAVVARMLIGFPADRGRSGPGDRDEPRSCSWPLSIRIWRRTNSGSAVATLDSLPTTCKPNGTPWALSTCGDQNRPIDLGLLERPSYWLVVSNSVGIDILGVYDSNALTHSDTWNCTMLIGYARTSTTEQEAGLDAQLRDLAAAGCERLFSERVSSVAPRAQLEAAISFVRDGDTLVVTKLDRLARSVTKAWEIVEKLEEKGTGLRILSLGGDTVDTRSATGKLILTIFAGFAQFEREMMLERQREGIAKAKTEGRYKGRKPTARAKAEEARRLYAEGKTVTDVAKALGIGRASVYRALEGVEN